MICFYGLHIIKFWVSLGLLLVILTISDHMYAAWALSLLKLSIQNDAYIVSWKDIFHGAVSQLLTVLNVKDKMDITELFTSELGKFNSRIDLILN